MNRHALTVIWIGAVLDATGKALLRLACASLCAGLVLLVCAVVGKLLGFDYIGWAAAVFLTLAVSYGALWVLVQVVDEVVNLIAYGLVRGED